MKDFLRRAISWGLQKLDKWGKSLSDSTTNPKNFEDLTPSDNLSKDEYADALKWALSNDKITNIALTGIYGSGKSSILRSFEKNNPGYEYLKISLASFSIDLSESERIISENDDSNKDLNRLIERSILQQIFYRAKPDEIPESRFKRIYSIKRRTLTFYSLLTLIWLFSIVGIFQPNTLSEIFLGVDLLSENQWLLDYLLPVIFVAGLAGLVFKIFHLFNNLTFSRLNITKGEIELAEEIDASILNEHLDEILYFFEVQKYDVVIIEDIDRFNNVDIFTKLRELNILLNQSKQVNRRIVFIYAIRDELFQDIHDHLNSRTKFFDFMIPVIPVINSNNSVEKLFEKLNESIESGELSREFISDIAIFIDDMRVLKNICNEYKIYRDKLGNDVGLDQEKLFSIIVYKNLFPEDFSKLHHKRGMVYSAFHKKKEITKGLKEDINQKIHGKEEKIGKIENESLKSVTELRNLYIYELLKSISQNDGVRSIRINNQYYDLNQIVEEQNFKALQKEGQIYYISSNGGNRRSNITFSQIEGAVDDGSTYQDRENIIKRKFDNGLEKLKNELEALKQKSNKLNSRKLFELFDEVNLGEILGDEVIKHDPLVYLLRNGYIDDELYENYITYFYEGSLTREDMKFVQSIKNRTDSPYDHKLSNIDEVLKKLRLRELSQHEILNFDLLNYLLEHDKRYPDQLNAVLEQLIDESEKSIGFIDLYVNKDQNNIATFIKKLSTKWLKFWDFIDNRSNYPVKKKNFYLDLIFRYADLEDISKLNDSSEYLLKKYISDRTDFISTYEGEEDLNKIKKILLKLQVKFKSLKSPQKESELLDFIYEENLYEINSHMIRIILQEKCKSDQSTLNRFKKAPYSTVKDSECEELKLYVDKSIEVFVENVLLRNEIDLEENEDHFIWLLNSENISNNIKQELIKNQSNPITDISNVTNTSLYQDLIDNFKVTPSWRNLFPYYKLNESIDEVLLSFLNEENNFKELSKERINEFDGPEELIDKFSQDLLLKNELSDTSFTYLLRSIPFTYNALAFDSLSKKKVQTMIETEFLNVTPANYLLLKTMFSPLQSALVEKNTDVFIQDFTQFKVDEDDLKLILRNSKIGYKDKLSIFQSFDSNEIKIDRELAELILESLLNNSVYEVSLQLSEKLMQEGKSISMKVRFLNTQIDFHGHDSISNLVESLPYPYYKMNRSRHRPKINKTDYNLELCKKLVRKGFISSFKEIKGNKIRVHAKV